MKKTTLILLIAIATSIGKLIAQIPAIVVSDKAGWHKISERKVDFKGDRDEILVAGADRFSAIKFKVTEAPIDLQDLEVFYESGDKQVIQVRTPILVGNESRVIDLNGGERSLKKIIFIYKTLANQKDKKAHVEIWGMKTNAKDNASTNGKDSQSTNAKNSASTKGNASASTNAIPDPAVVPSIAIMTSDKAGWHKIGERKVDFSTDRDEILVVGADRFSAIKFKVNEAAIDLQDLEVYYETGDKQIIQVRTPLQLGNESRVIDLNGGERSLKKIIFVYKTVGNQKDKKAHVEIWGLKTNAKASAPAKENTGVSTDGNPGTSVTPSVAVMSSDKVGWHKIGERKVDFSRDRDEILVAGADRFSAIKFKVTEAPIDLQDLEVYYESGDKQVIQVRTPLQLGNESRVIDLNGGERSLKKIIFVYKTVGNQKDKKAHVEIWGLKTNANASAPAKENTSVSADGNSSTSVTPSVAIMTSDKAGWHKIGERKVDFTNDRDEILVIGADRFSAIKFKVSEAAIDLQDLEVYYETGDKQVIQVRTPILLGTESRVIDLNGGERSLKKIIFVYKTLANQTDKKANVEVWGLKTNAKVSASAKENTSASTDGNPGTSVTPSVAIITSDKTGWHKIGERKVDFSTDRDEILVTGADRFSAIKFKVTEAAIDLQDLEVYYETGDKQIIQVRNPIQLGLESRVIDLNGGERSLKKIMFKYKTLSNQKDKKAHVELWGLKTNAKASTSSK